MCACLLGLQPIIVPAGRISLGRIFNVLGATIDRYLELPLSSQFGTFPYVEMMGSDRCVESSEQYAYALYYPGTETLISSASIHLASHTEAFESIDSSIPSINKLFWRHLLVNTCQRLSNPHSWLFYSASILHFSCQAIQRNNHAAASNKWSSSVVLKGLTTFTNTSLLAGSALHCSYNAETRFAWAKAIATF
jgi:hypothetical protein